MGLQFSLGFDAMERVEVNVSTRQNLIEAAEARLAAGLGFSLATLNLDHLVKLRLIRSFRRAYAEQTFVVADGNPIVWLSRLAGRPVDLVPGCELVEPLAQAASRVDAPVALLGASEETLARAAARLTAAHPGLRVVARIAPSRDFSPDGPEADLCIERLARSGARLCFIALGAPKQEVFAARAQQALPQCGFVSIGAGLDFLAGSQRRAPRWMRRLALEWLWRFATNPRRLGVRYFRCALILPGLAVEAFRSRLSPPLALPQV